MNSNGSTAALNLDAILGGKTGSEAVPPGTLDARAPAVVAIRGAEAVENVVLQGNLVGLSTRGGELRVLQITQPGQMPQVLELWHKRTESHAFAWLPDGRLCVPKGRQRIICRDGISGRRLDSCFRTSGVISTVTAYEDEYLAGITDTGLLQRWHQGYTMPADTFPVPAPSSLNSPSHLRYWPAANVLVYQGMDGHLVIIDVEKRTYQTITAHKGQFFTYCILGDDLWTFAPGEGAIWKPGGETPYKRFQHTLSPISATACGNGSRSLILVDADGSAAYASVDDDGPRFEGYFPGDGYCVVLGIARDDAHIDTTAGIRLDDEAQTPQQPPFEVPQPEDFAREEVQKLQRLAHEAVQENRLADALRLLRNISHVEGGEPTSVLAALDDLVCLCLWEGLLRLGRHVAGEAIEIARRNEVPEGAWEHLRLIEQLTKPEDYVFCTQRPLEALLTAANELETSLEGSFCITAPARIESARDEIDLEEILRILKDSLRSNPTLHSACLSYKKMRWFEGAGADARRTLLIAQTADESEPHYSCAISFEVTNDCGLNLTPLLWTPQPQGGIGAEEHNQRISALLNSSPWKSWCDRVYKVLCSAVMRINTKKASKINT